MFLFVVIVVLDLSTSFPLLPTSQPRSSLPAAPLNAQWSGRLEQRRRISTLYPDFAVVANAAERLLLNDDDTLSIWLFGSRARGTARADSDWDVALVTSSCASGKLAHIACAPSLVCGYERIETNCLHIPIDVFLNQRLTFPHIAWAIAHEGIPLAQRQWRLPIHQLNETFTMNFQEYRAHLAHTPGRIGDISAIYEILADLDRFDVWDMKCDQLQEHTQTMAEGFIKAGCIQRGYEKFPRVHDFYELAEGVRKELGDDDFAATIEALNGNSALDNLTRYGLSQDPSQLAGAINRLCNLCDALPNELRRHGAAFRRANENDALSVLNELARTTANEMSRANATLSRLKVVTSVPDFVSESTTARVMLAWKEVDSISSAISRAERDIRIEFRLSRSAEREADREIDDD